MLSYCLLYIYGHYTLTTLKHGDQCVDLATELISYHSLPSFPNHFYFKNSIIQEELVSGTRQLFNI